MGRKKMKYAFALFVVATFVICSQSHASSLAIEFGANGLQTQAYSSGDTSKKSDLVFSTTFSGKLITTYDPRNSQIRGGGSASLGNGWVVTSFFASQTFEAGSLIGGNLSIIARHSDGSLNTLDATFANNSGNQNIFQQVNDLGGFSIASEIETIRLNGMDGSVSTFAGYDMSSAMAQDWLGSLLRLQFNPNEFGYDYDSGASFAFSIVVPLPTPVLMGLTGLLPVVIISLRRRRAAKS